MAPEDQRQLTREARWQAVAEGKLDRRVAEWMDARDCFAEQDTQGVDLSLIFENLKLSGTERLERNVRHRTGIARLRRHG